MRTTAFLMLLVLSGGCLSSTRSVGGIQTDTSAYACGIHREVVSNHPCTCQNCGTTLIKVELLPHVMLAQKIPSLYVCPIHPNVFAYKPTTCPICGLNLEKPTPPSGKVFTCPIHPEIRSGEPGICPKCGLKLEPFGIIKARYRR